MKPWWIPDARGVIGIGIYLLVLMVFALMAWNAELRQDEFFKTVSTLIVGAFIKDVVAWAYSATKGGGELAERNAAIVEQKTGDKP
jgi:hypothetical protein